MNNLKNFIKQLEQENELVRIKEFVSIDKEIAEINDRIVKSRGKALLFENNESKFPVLVNMFGTEKRISMALRVSKPSDLTDRIDSLFKMAKEPKLTFMSKLKLFPLLKDVSRWMPKHKKGKGACQDIILKGNNINLFDLPILKCAPFDAGPFVTLPLVNTVDPETGARNVGMYRLQVMSKNTTGMHWHKHKTGERHYQKYKELNKLMPIAVCIGGDPSYTYSATAPLPEGIDEYILSGFIRQKPVKLVKCITNDLRVPEDCDFVIEGYINPVKDKVTEGPFGDHTGFYSLEGMFPQFNVTCITHRKDAIYTATVVGVPPQEDAYIGLATERIFLSPIKAIMQQEITDMFLPFQAVAHNFSIINIEKEYCAQALKVANGLWGAGQMMLNKFLMIVSLPNARLNNYEMYKESLKNMIISESVITSRGPLDILDHNSSVCGYGGKMAIDLTKRVEQESEKNDVNISIPKSVILPSGFKQAGTSLAENGWSILLLSAERAELDLKNNIKNILSENNIEGINMIFIFDKEHDLTDISTLAWIAGNNIDPIRDAIIENDYIVFDARSKFEGSEGFNRPWPNVVTQDQETIMTVDKKWDRLGLGDFIESPSLKYLKLKFKGTSNVVK